MRKEGRKGGREEGRERGMEEAYNKIIIINHYHCACVESICFNSLTNCSVFSINSILFLKTIHKQVLNTHTHTLLTQTHTDTHTHTHTLLTLHIHNILTSCTRTYSPSERGRDDNNRMGRRKTMALAQSLFHQPY